MFRSILESVSGQTMLDYTAFVNRLLAMHWSGMLQLMSRHGASRQQVIARTNTHVSSSLLFNLHRRVPTGQRKLEKVREFEWSGENIFWRRQGK